MQGCPAGKPGEGGFIVRIAALRRRERRLIHVCVCLTILGGGLAPEAEAAGKPDFARVSFEARLDPAETLDDRTVTPGQPFMRRRLTAMKSATLTEALTLPVDDGGGTLAAGTRLLYAKGARGEYWCAVNMMGKFASVMTGSYDRQWVCLEDSDKDGSLDTAYRTPRNPGSYLPSFDRVESPSPVKAVYAVDADKARAYYETAVVYQPTFNIYGRMFFYIKVRASGDEAWHDIASVTQGLRGGYESIPGDKLPTDMVMDGTRFTVMAKTDQGVTIHPLSVGEGTRSYSLLKMPGRR